MMFIRLLFILLLINMTSYPLWAATASDYQLLGLKLATASKDDIRKNLYQWHSFEPTDTTRDNTSFNRFYTKHLLRETYRLDFRYEKDGQFSSMNMLYRPFYAEYAPKEIDIPDILKQLVPMIGSPNIRIKRVVSGLPAYNAYQWEDDTMSITLDHENQQTTRPPVLSVRMKSGVLASNYRP